LRFARPDTVFWVQDYHFLTLAADMRAIGIDRPIGFFLHTPLPERSALMAVPRHRDLIGAMLAYDVIGFQTESDRWNFADYAGTLLGCACVGDCITSDFGVTRLGVFPISIDAEAFASRATKSVARPEVTRLRSSLHGGKLVIGVDRIDYSKGIANRIEGFARMIERQPAMKRSVSMLQIAVPSREQIPAYGALNAELATLVTDVNAKLGEVDWTPVRYINKGFAQPTLAGFYRTAQVGLVTSLHDGMNLVAKEYVAAQNPFDPGVLVLSEFAGAARELDGALMINPHDIDAIAAAISTALSMPGDERRERWTTMMQHLRATSVQSWFDDFVAALEDVRAPSVVPALSAGPPEWRPGIGLAAVKPV